MLRVKPLLKILFKVLPLLPDQLPMIWPNPLFLFVIFSFYPLFCNWPSWSFFLLATLPLLVSVTMETYYSSCVSSLLLLKLWPAMCLLFGHFSTLVSTMGYLLSFPSHLNYSFWATSMIFVLWSHPISDDGPQIVLQFWAIS